MPRDRDYPGPIPRGRKVRRKLAGPSAPSNCSKVDLPHPLGPGDRDELAFVNGEIDSAQCFDLTFVKLAGKSFRFEKRYRAGSRWVHPFTSIRPAEKLPARWRTGDSI